MPNMSSRSCQFFYFHNSMTDTELSRILDGIALEREKDLLHVQYRGTPKKLKGKITFDPKDKNLDWEFCFNRKKNALLLAGTSQRRKIIARLFISKIIGKKYPVSPLAKMSAETAYDLGKKITSYHKQSRGFNPVCDFNDGVYEEGNQKYEIIPSGKLAYGLCSFADDPKFKIRYEKCKDAGGDLTFDCKLHLCLGIVDDHDKKSKTMRVRKFYSFSTYNDIDIDNWLVFSNVVIKTPLELHE